MSIKKVKLLPKKDLSHLGTLCFDDGFLGFRLIVEGDKYSVGDKLLFYPCMSIDKYSISDTKKRFLKHVIYDIYEFTFKPVAKYQNNDRPAGYYKFKDINSYLLEIMPGFNVFHFNFTKASKDYLKIGTLYRAYGRLSNFDHMTLLENPNIDAYAIKRLRCIGVLEKIQPNLFMKDFRKNYSGNKQNKIRKSMTDKTDTLSYEDALENIGYPEDELKFRVNVSDYKNKSPNLQSTDENKNNDMLFYYLKML